MQGRLSQKGSMPSALYNALDKQVKLRELEAGYSAPDLRTGVSPSAVDFFSNDYLGLGTNADVRDIFLKKLTVDNDVFGTRASVSVSPPYLML